MSRDDRLRLAFVALHPDRRRALTERAGGPGGAIAALRRGRVRASAAVRERAALPAAECRRRLDVLGVDVWFSGDPGFPDWLALRPDAPDLLFGRGVMPPTPGVAIVGTRRCTRYGRALARAYGAVAAAAGWPVISGLARGIDGEAHLGVVDNGGVGIAVLGSGPDVIYPPEHRELAGRLIEGGGAILTEYPPGTRPDGWRFPARNRIISGLSRAVVVVEAAETGGALITATLAAEAGLPVFAVPGDVDRPSSVGCNRLIRDGAIPILNPADFEEAISLVLGPPRSREAGRGEASAARFAESLPLSGATLEDAALLWGLDAAAAAEMATGLELAGLVRWEGGLLIPVDR